MAILEIVKQIIKYCHGKVSASSLLTRIKVLAAMGILLIAKLYFGSRSMAKVAITKLPISQFFSAMNKAVLQQVYIYPRMLMAKDKFSNIIKSEHAGMPSTMLFNELKNSNINFQYVGHFLSNPKFDYIIFLVSASLAFFIYYLFIRTGESRKSSKPTQRVTFDDIVGLDSAKIALKEVLDYMINPLKYNDRGARMRRGVLLYGPPGTGKTTLAKACANEAGIPFYACNAAEFCEIYVGMGPKKVRDLFEKARQTAPCVVFIDQLDALGARGSENSIMFESANSEKNSTINQILTEIDGFETSDKVLVIAATNRLEMVDKSLVRSGRFDVKISIPLPSLQTKMKIFQKYLSKTTAKISQGFATKLLESSSFASGADIEAMINEAIYVSIRRNSVKVQEQDILVALQQYQHVN